MRYRLASTAPRQRDMFACPFAPQMAMLISDFCSADEQERVAKLSELKEMIAAHPLAADKFLSICKPDLPGLSDASALVDYVRSLVPPAS